MRNRTITVLLVSPALIAGAAYFFLSRTVRCDQAVGPAVWGPNGQLAATSTMEACPVGLLSSTNTSVSVSLNSNPQGSKKPTLVFQLNDAAELPTLTWVNGNELNVRLNEEGEVQVARHEADGIKITYTVPRWIWERLGTIEADRVKTERESQNLYKAGKISKQDLQASGETDNAVAQERSSFRQWILANATVQDSLQ